MSDACSIPENATCWTCGYLLRGLTEQRCPECGRVFDPANPKTVNLGQPQSWWARTALRPPSWILVGLYVLGGTLGLVAGSVPGGNFPAIILFAYFVLGGGGVWLLHLIIAEGFRLAYKVKRRWRRKAIIGWLAYPLAVGIGMLALATEFPLYVRFALSFPSMNALLDQASKNPEALSSERWVGLFYVDDIQPMNGGVRMHLPGAGFLDIVGFEYSPSGPPDVSHSTYTRLLGGWYYWEQGW